MPRKKKAHKSDVEKLVVNMELLYIVYILRTQTTPNKPETHMLASEVTTALKSCCLEILEGEDLKRSIRPKLDILAREIAESEGKPAESEAVTDEILDEITDEQEADFEDEVQVLQTLYNNVIPKVFGGRVRRRPSDKKNGSYYYYFEPFLADEHAELVAGALTASQFLASQEKEYLVNAIQHLSSLGYERHNYKNQEVRSDSKLDDTSEQGKKVVFGEEFSYAKLPVKPKIPKLDKTSLPGVQARYLSIVSSLDYAIKNKCVIYMEYGRYTTRRGSTELSFETRMNAYTSNQPYPMSMVKPYALFWDNGSHYLLCSGYQDMCEGSENKSDQEQPLVYRVDKIIRVMLALNKESLKKNAGGKVHWKADEYAALDPERYIRWSGYPAAVRDYFNKEGVFDEERYTIEHPLMAYMYQYASQFVDCTLETTVGALSVLVDYFGSDKDRIRVSELPEKAPEDRPWEQKVRVTLKHIQYHSLRQFCTQFSHIVVVKSPERLRKAVQYRIEDTESKWDVHDEL